MSTCLFSKNESFSTRKLVTIHQGTTHYCCDATIVTDSFDLIRIFFDNCRITTADFASTELAGSRINAPDVQLALNGAAGDPRSYVEARNVWH
jgi:hypothetical protein